MSRYSFCRGRTRKLCHESKCYADRYNARFLEERWRLEIGIALRYQPWCRFEDGRPVPCSVDGFGNVGRKLLQRSRLQ